MGADLRRRSSSALAHHGAEQRGAEQRGASARKALSTKDAYAYY